MAWGLRGVSGAVTRMDSRVFDPGARPRGVVPEPLFGFSTGVFCASGCREFPRRVVSVWSGAAA